MDAGTKTWIHGILAAFIGGAAGAIETALILPAFDYAKFNFDSQLKTMLTACVVFGFLSGVKTTVTYLKQSPIPQDVAVQQTLSITQTPTGQATATATAKSVPAAEATAVDVKPLAPDDPVLKDKETAAAEIESLRKQLAGKTVTNKV